tara:strand:+ start:61 stop:690 length:630 start_codon:yes stop_codon:yes gene_type:complete
MKRKLSISVFLFLTTLMFSQQLTESGKEYSEVVEVEFKKDAIYQKIKEWISLTYKSSNDVLQLDTENKLITKSNMVVKILAYEYKFDYRISFTMVFSIKENRYKIDLTPTGIESVAYPDQDIGSAMLEMFMTKEVLLEENYLVLSKEMAYNTFKKMGWSDKKSMKALKKNEDSFIKEYDSYKINKANFDIKIKSLYTSVKNAITKKDDW